MGTDLISDIKSWDEGPKMLKETNFIIFERNGYHFETSHANWPSNFKLISCRDTRDLLGSISSTEVRRKIKMGLPTSDLITTQVE